MYSEKIVMDTEQGMSTLKVYEYLNNHMIEALMFHDQMADLYDFLNLHGFKRMHEYQHIAESMDRRKLKRYVLNHHHKLLMDEDIHNPKVIPIEWYEYNRFDVTQQVRKQSLMKSFRKYKEWESNTKDMYNSASEIIFKNKNMADFEFIMMFLKDVDDELKRLERLELELAACDYDMDYVMTIQDKYHEMYKEKTAKLSI